MISTKHIPSIVAHCRIQNLRLALNSGTLGSGLVNRRIPPRNTDENSPRYVAAMKMMHEMLIVNYPPSKGVELLVLPSTPSLA